METWTIGLMLVLLCVLIFKRRFWFVVFTLGSLDTVLESLAHFSHLYFIGAVGYAIASFVCWSLAAAIGGYSPSGENTLREKQTSTASRDQPDWSPH